MEEIRQKIICLCGEDCTVKLDKLKELKSIFRNVIILDGEDIIKYINPELEHSLIGGYKVNKIITNIAELLYNQGFNIIINTVRADIAFEILIRNNILCELIKT